MIRPSAQPKRSPRRRSRPHCRRHRSYVGPRLHARAGLDPGRVRWVRRGLGGTSVERRGVERSLLWRGVEASAHGERAEDEWDGGLRVKGSMSHVLSHSAGTEQPSRQAEWLRVRRSAIMMPSRTRRASRRATASRVRRYLTPTAPIFCIIEPRPGAASGTPRPGVPAATSRRASSPAWRIGVRRESCLRHSRSRWSR